VEARPSAAAIVGGEEAVLVPEAVSEHDRVLRQVQAIVRLAEGLAVVEEDLHQVQLRLSRARLERGGLCDQREMAGLAEEPAREIVLGGDRGGAGEAEHGEESEEAKESAQHDLSPPA
jgi:hypothetical protein